MNLEKKTWSKTTPKGFERALISSGRLHPSPTYRTAFLYGTAGEDFWRTMVLAISTEFEHYLHHITSHHVIPPYIRCDG